MSDNNCCAKTDANNKPVVTFGKLTGFVDYKGKGVKALLSDVKGHPVLGELPSVHTSLVLSMKHDPTTYDVVEFETLNTRYVKE
jgi:hypothetical protein